MTRTAYPDRLAGSGVIHAAWSSLTASSAHAGSIVPPSDVVSALTPINLRRHTYTVLRSTTKHYEKELAELPQWPGVERTQQPWAALVVLV